MLLNGANLMFCEDAARRVQSAVDADEDIADFHVRIIHLESLHAHDAVADGQKSQRFKLNPPKSKEVPMSDSQGPEGGQQLGRSFAAVTGAAFFASFFFASRFFLLPLLI